MHKAQTIRVVKVPDALLDGLARHLDRNNRWDLSVHEGRVNVVVGAGEVVESALETVPLQPPA